MVQPSCEFMIRAKGKGLRSPRSFFFLASMTALKGARAIALQIITPSNGQRIDVVHESDISVIVRVARALCCCRSSRKTASQARPAERKLEYWFLPSAWSKEEVRPSGTRNSTMTFGKHRSSSSFLPPTFAHSHTAHTQLSSRRGVGCWVGG